MIKHGLIQLHQIALAQSLREMDVTVKQDCVTKIGYKQDRRQIQFKEFKYQHPRELCVFSHFLAMLACQTIPMMIQLVQENPV